MPLQPPNKLYRERILVYGTAGTGKSYNFYTIARTAAKTGSDAIFYVVDTDVSVGRMVSDPDLAVLFDDAGDLRNIKFTDVYDWETLNAAVDEYQKIMRPQDWLMIDMTTVTWQWVQDYFTRSVYKADKSDYFINRRAQEAAANKEGRMFEGNLDWTYINGLYGDFKNKILRNPGHVYCTAEAKALDSKNADKQTKLMFGNLGITPAGQKGMPFLFHTNLLVSAFKPGEFKMTSAKNRSLPPLESESVGDFSISFLIKNSGWRLA